MPYPLIATPQVCPPSELTNKPPLAKRVTCAGSLRLVA